MRKRRGGSPRTTSTRDDEFNRNSSRYLREGSNNSSSSSLERQLFDPRSDNPIHFNKTPPPARPTSILRESNDTRRSSTPITRTLWTGNNDDEEKVTSRQPQVITTAPRIMERKLKRNSNNNNNNGGSSSSNNSEMSFHSIKTKEIKPTTKTIKTTTATTTAAAVTTEKEMNRRKLKVLIGSIHSIEASISKVTEASRNLTCFIEQQPKETSRYETSETSQKLKSKTAAARSKNSTIITEQDILDAEKIWREKMDLHLLLGNKYLQVLELDADYAEKKGLESLCWKRAVYSLVEQFRGSLKRSSLALLQQEKEKKKKNQKARPVIFGNELDELELSPIIITDDDDDENDIVDGKTNIANKKMKIKLTKMTLSLFLEFLDRADVFYQQLSVFLKSIDTSRDLDEMETYLSQWRRTKAYKWFSCINLRGDIARYRWSYLPEDFDEDDEGDADNGNSNDDEETEREGKRKNQWTKRKAFEEAWKRYFLGVWLMPAKGNLYFNLSLLLQQPQQQSNQSLSSPSNNIQGYGFHKLYFSIRSLMVRRNGFLNAREGVITLFENNRCWLNNYLTSISKSKKLSKVKTPLPTVMSGSGDLISAPALFIRLHGMLFTKIGLDEFPKTKRMFFESLFPKRQQRRRSEEDDEEEGRNKKQTELDRKNLYHLSSSSQFWFEMIILCLSSLYTYDYSNSKLTKLISNNKNAIFTEEDMMQQQQQQQQNKQQEEQDSMVEDMKNNILFVNGIDLTCQIAVEIFQAYLDRFNLKVPELPELPDITLEIKPNSSFLFENNTQNQEAEEVAKETEEKKKSVTKVEEKANDFSELIYLEILLHWMVMNGICLQKPQERSLWEDMIGDIDYDLVFKGNNRHSLTHERKSNISPAFWPLLLEFLTKLLSELPESDRYEMVNHHFLNDDDDDNDDDDKEEEIEKEMAKLLLKQDGDVSKREMLFSRDIFNLMGSQPNLPEEQQLRGLGWIDEVHGRLLKLGFKKKRDKTVSINIDHHGDSTLLRKLKILNYGFTLVKNLENVLHYDAVHEVFTVSKDVEERLVSTHQQKQPSMAATGTIQTMDEEDEDEESYDDTEMVSTISAMDDDVLLSNDTDYSVDEDDDDIMTQLKKRREQLQSMIATNEQEQQTGYHRLPARVKERKAKLNYLRQHIIPGKTVLVLDTNCFIGHIDLVKKLINSAKWSIVVPLVVVTELDGLRSSTQKLGSAAQQAIELIEGVLAMKQRQNQSLRVQTSHNNFLSDISIRSEQFIFGETDKNLDDLVLSACLWWVSQSHDKNTVPVCLVTGDRNLSVKARARDVEVAPVSAIMQLTPK